MALNFITPEKYEARPRAELYYLILKDIEGPNSPWPDAKFNASRRYLDYTISNVDFGYFDTLAEAQAACQTDFDQLPP